MQVINVEIQNEERQDYKIYIGEGASEKVSNILEDILTQKVLVVTNETIYELYSEKLNKIFDIDKISVRYCILPDGEVYKNKTSLETILTCAFESKLDRNDTIVAFGGGVIGDITGFAAAIYMRGIKFIQIPTTILAQVDSSVGGKVAINTPYGKNLVGAFYQPKAVLSDLNFLRTLPKREILTGLSEVIKYSFIEKNCNTAFYDFAKFLYVNQKSILNVEKENISKCIETSCNLKSAIVTLDEKEKGLRKVLNFGHTIGHAVEKCTHYDIFTHGEAVSIGMRAAFLIALQLGKINMEYFNFAKDLLNSYGMNFKIPQNITTDDIITALVYDKKAKNGSIQFVIPTGYAKVEILENIDNQIITNALKELY